MKQEVVTKKMFLWNIIGCVLNSSTSFVLLAFVTRNVPIKEAGYFSIAFATAQLLLSFGKYGVRAFQVTDVNNLISYQAFVVNRILTSMGMVGFSVIYAAVSGSNLQKALVIVCVSGIKVTDAVEDVFHGELQLNGRIDIAGKLLTGRSIFTIIVFFLFIVCTHNLVLTCFLTAIGSLTICIIINMRAMSEIERPKLPYNKTQIGYIFKECFPLFMGSFLSILIYNMPKYAIDSLSTELLQTVYNIIFMPAFVINMISEFGFKPLLTPLACYWNDKKMKEVKKIIVKLLICLLGITLIVLSGGFVCGIPVLEFVYNIDLSDYKRELMLLLVGGGFSATVYLAYNLLTLMRAQKFILPGYMGGVVLAIVMSWILVKNYGIAGAALTYLCTEILMVIYFIAIIRVVIKNHGSH